MKKYVHLSVLLISILFSIQATAQSPRKILREANQFIEVELYDEAINALRPLVENDHPEATLLTGISLLNQEENMTRASETLQKAARLYPLQQKKIDETTIEAHFYLGQSFRMNGRAEKACETFKNLKRFITNNDLIVQIDREIEYCLNMQLLKQNPVNIEIEHLGKVLNSPYEDHSPIVLYDESTMYFTSNRPSDTTNMTGPYFENIFESHWRNGKWTEPKVLDIPNTSEANKATVGLTPDGQGLIFYQNSNLSSGLYITQRTFDGWSQPEPLPAPINSGYNESHASISSDGNTIFFSSERPGGLGGKDIYFANKLPDGTWGKPINCSKKINTSMDEEGPFIHPDNETLYFSSSGHNSMGGYDIFMSKKDEDGKWGEVKNIGYPINTPKDELFYLPTPNGQRVYFASRREESIGQTDLFIFHYPKTNERSTAVISSHVFNSNNQPAENAIISVKNKSTNKTIGTFRPNPSTGKFIAIIPAGQQYELIIESKNHAPYSKSFEIGLKDDYKSKQRAIYLPAITLKKK